MQHMSRDTAWKTGHRAKAPAARESAPAVTLKVIKAAFCQPSVVQEGRNWEASEQMPQKVRPLGPCVIVDGLPVLRLPNPRCMVGAKPHEHGHDGQLIRMQVKEDIATLLGHRTQACAQCPHRHEIASPKAACEGVRMLAQAVISQQPRGPCASCEDGRSDRLGRA